MQCNSRAAVPTGWGRHSCEARSLGQLMWTRLAFYAKRRGADTSWAGARQCLLQVEASESMRPSKEGAPGLSPQAVGLARRSEWSRHISMRPKKVGSSCHCGALYAGAFMGFMQSCSKQAKEHVGTGRSRPRSRMRS